MEKIILLLSFFLFSSIYAQNYSDDNLLGYWKIQNIDGKKLSSGIAMNLNIEPGKMIISNNFEEINCSWSFSNNRKYIYCSNEKSDEDWLLVELTESRLVIVDKGKKMEFLKTAKYNGPLQRDSYAEVNKTESIEIEKHLLGDWRLIKIDSKVMKNNEYSLSFRPKGGLSYNFEGIQTSASWALNDDKKSLKITAFNGLSETWVITWIINTFQADEMKLYVAGKYYFFIRN
jgi:hypothetical protein